MRGSGEVELLGHWAGSASDRAAGAQGVAHGPASGGGLDAGGADGWRIADDRLWRAAGNTAWNTHTDDVLKLVVRGIDKAADTTPRPSPARR